MSFPSRVRGGDPTAQRFPLFSALRMASPDTIILLTVDYHAAIGCHDPRAPPPLAYAPVYVTVGPRRSFRHPAVPVTLEVS